MKEEHRKLLIKTAQVIRQLQREKNYLIEKLATKHHEEHASFIAKDLVKRGIHSQEELEELVAKVAKLKNLGAVKEAAELFSPGKDLPFGEVEKVASDNIGPASDRERKLLEDPAIQYLMGHV